MVTVFYDHKEVLFIDFFDCGNSVLLRINVVYLRDKGRTFIVRGLGFCATAPPFCITSGPILPNEYVTGYGTMTGRL